MIGNGVLRRTALGAALVLAALGAQAQGPRPPQAYKEGKDYLRIEPAVSLGPVAKGKVEVVEFFWYGCPHCYRLQKPWEKWLEANGKLIDYKPQPAVLGRSWELMARAYHSMVAVGGFDKGLHRSFFDGIHEKALPLQTLESDEPVKLYEYVAERKGADYGAKFKKEYMSFGIAAKIAKDRETQKLFQLQGTPTIVVAGKYSVNPSQAGTEDNMVPIVDFLVKKAHAEAKAAGK